MRPAGSGENTLLTLDEAVESPVSSGPVNGISLGDWRIALETELAAEAGSSTSLAVETYTGPNELVRFNQEGYADLPGLFSPNILGRLSLGLIWLLVWIHGFVGRSEEHTSELQSRGHLVCRLLLEKKKHQDVGPRRTARRRKRRGAAASGTCPTDCTGT